MIGHVVFCFACSTPFTTKQAMYGSEMGNGYLYCKARAIHLWQEWPENAGLLEPPKRIFRRQCL